MKLFKNILLAIFAVLAFSRCENTNSYFDEPAWLETTIYNQLQTEGRFSSYLACVDRTAYAPVLKEGGLYTVFAPNDDAFKLFLQKKNYSSVANIPKDEVDAIVAYSMVFSKWKSEQLGSIYSSGIYTDGLAFKKKTNYYAGAYQDPDFDNKWVVDQNRIGGYISSDYNFKYLPVFSNSYFLYSSLTAEDYNTFFPGTEYVGAQSSAKGILGNVMDAKIVTPNIITRNGIIHEVSAVNEPLGNVEKLLRENEQYSVFRSLLNFKTLSNSYIYKSYEENSDLTQLYKLIKPDANIDKVYVKTYDINNYLFFSPAYELYDNDLSLTETNGYTLFVPNNDSLNEYINKRLLKYYPTIHDLPLEAITKLINTHISDGTVWPSKFKGAQASTGEYVNGEGASGAGYADFKVLGQKIASNGLVYQIDHVIKSKLFETVYGGIFLNPKYSYLNAAYVNYYNNSLRENLMNSKLTGNSTVRYTLLLPSNDLLTQDGFTFNSTTSAFSNSLIVGSNVETRLKNLLRMHIFEGYKKGDVNTEISSFSEQGPAASLYDGWNFRVSYYGDLIRYKNNKVQASGNIDEGTSVTVTPIETFENGTVYSIDKMLQYSTRETTPGVSAGWNQKRLWYYLSKARTENSNVKTFVDYVETCLKNTSDELLGISEDNYYTVLMVNNTRMTSAINNKDLPTLTEIANDATALEKACNFLRAHFLQGKVYPDDRFTYIYPYNASEPNKSIASTMYKITNVPLGLVNQRTTVVVSKNADGSLNIAPQNVVVDGKTVVVGSQGVSSYRIMTGKTSVAGNDGLRSNRIAGRSVLHEFYGYLKFQIQQ